MNNPLQGLRVVREKAPLFEIVSNPEIPMPASFVESMRRHKLEREWRRGGVLFVRGAS